MNILEPTMEDVNSKFLIENSRYTNWARHLHEINSIVHRDLYLGYTIVKPPSLINDT